MPVLPVCADPRDPVHGAVARSVRAAVALLGRQRTHAVRPKPDVDVRVSDRGIITRKRSII